MPFASLNHNLDYWQKQSKDHPLFPDLAWNIPEQKTGHLRIIGGSEQGISSILRLAEYITAHFPLKTVSLLLPDKLSTKLPPLPGLDFAPSTSTGSFDKSEKLYDAFTDNDFTLLAGDFSRNSSTAVALTSAIQHSLEAVASPAPLLLTRDTIDLLAPSMETILRHQSLFLVASLAQLQKVFRAVYYPKMLMLSQPLLAIIETLHKFTLSYPVTLLTLHDGKIIVANGGEITTTKLDDTAYSSLSIWAGPLAANVAALNLYNPHKPLPATTSAILFTN